MRKEKKVLVYTVTDSVTNDVFAFTSKREAKTIANKNERFTFNFAGLIEKPKTKFKRFNPCIAAYYHSYATTSTSIIGTSLCGSITLNIINGGVVEFTCKDIDQKTFEEFKKEFFDFYKNIPYLFHDSDYMIDNHLFQSYNYIRYMHSNKN